MSNLCSWSQERLKELPVSGSLGPSPFYFDKHLQKDALNKTRTYHRKYNPVPPVTIGTRPLLRTSLVAFLASSKNCPTEYSNFGHHVS